MKPVDQRQSSIISTPESSSVPTAHPLAVPMLQSHWTGSTETQWTGSGVAMPVGQQPVATSLLPPGPAVSLSPGSVLPINLPPELSSVFGINPSTTALSSASLPVNLLLPGGLLVSADSRNVHDPLASLSRLSSGIQNMVPATNMNNNIMPAEARKMTEDINGARISGVKVESDIAHSYSSYRQGGASLDLGRRLAVSVTESSKPPGGLSSAYATVKSEHPQQGLQLPLVSEPPQMTSVNFPALHQLLQQGATSRSGPPAPPSYSKVSESTLPARSNSSPATTESTVAQSSGRRRWISADSAVFNRQSCQGLPDYSGDVLATLFRQESSGFDTSKNGLAPTDSHLSDPLMSDSADNDAAEFSAPSGPGLHHKFRRKHRPQPLIIPSPVGHFGFQSRLRSPRISSDQSGPALPNETCSSSAAVAATSSGSVASLAGLTPYTPPPMLSPVRTGSGLFYSLIQPSPKSAPVGFRLGLMRCSKSFCPEFFAY